jgi:hypothetical protein
MNKPDFSPVLDYLDHYTQKALLIVALIDKYKRLDMVQDNNDVPFTIEKGQDAGESPA